MKITNKYDVPKTVYNAIVKLSEYSNEGDYSVTDLLKPPRIVHLTKRFWDVIEIDASDLIPSFIGNIGHLTMEAASVGLSEQRLKINVLGRKITGKADHYDPIDYSIDDYKFVGAGIMKVAERINEYASQVNCYGYLFEQNGFRVDQLRLILFFRDWYRVKVGQLNYPEMAMKVVDVLKWPAEKVYDFIHERVEQLAAAEMCSDDDLPECTAQERWEKPACFAVHIKGQKKAKRLLETYADAEQWIAENGVAPKKYEIIERPGVSVRCQEYCDVKHFCSQYVKMVDIGGGAE
jgi:hypothetical protein